MKQQVKIVSKVHPCFHEQPPMVEHIVAGVGPDLETAAVVVAVVAEQEIAACGVEHGSNLELAVPLDSVIVVVVLES